MKKTCVACSKQIPSVALDCVFCGAKQPLPEGELAVDTAQRPSRHATDETLLNFTLADLEKRATAESRAEAPRAANGSGAPLSSQTRATATMKALVLPAAAGESAPLDDSGVVAVPGAARPMESLGRTVMGVGGVVLLALFLLPWHGVSSWRLLETLSGADFARQLFYLSGGLVLLATAALPVPFSFRATVGALVAATPVMLGARGVLGWRGLVAGLALLALPATHLLRAQAKSSRAARALMGAAVAAVAILYLAPVSSVVPIAQAFRMIGSGQVGLAVIGLFVLIPLGFTALSVLGLLGRDLTDVGVLLAVLWLFWAPVVVALRGLLVGDGTQIYVALALLWASATSAVSWAQLLSHRSA